MQPFIDSDSLTYYEDGQLHTRAITIIGTGNTPIKRVINASRRYIFFDAPLVGLKSGFTIDGIHHEYHWSIAPMASSKWPWSLYYPNVAAVKKYSDLAHSKGIKARWWGLARWPGPLRRYLWDLQWRAGVDWLNADDLEDVARFLKEKGAGSELRGASERQLGDL
jgi:hypothetical protein